MACSDSGSRYREVKLRLPAPQVGRLSASSGRARARTNRGWLRDHSSRYSRKSSKPSSAHCMSSKTMTVVRCSASRSNRMRHAEKRFSWSPGAPTSSPSRWASLGSTQLRSSGSGTCSSIVARSFASADRGSSSSTMSQRIRTISASAQ